MGASDCDGNIAQFDKIEKLPSSDFAARQIPKIRRKNIFFLSDPIFHSFEVCSLFTTKKVNHFYNLI